MISELRNLGQHVNQQRFARLMHEFKLTSNEIGSFQCSTQPQRGHGIPDCLNCQCKATQPDDLWVADTTTIYITDVKY